MHGAAARHPATPDYQDHVTEAEELHRAARREMTAATAALGKLRRGQLLMRATDEVAIIGVRMAGIEAAMRELAAAMFCREQEDGQQREDDRRAPLRVVCPPE
jgi:hypothetical protein